MFRRLKIESTVPALPGPVFRPLAGTSVPPVHTTLAALDTLPPSGHRVLGEWGLRGDGAFLVLTGVDPFDTVNQLYPDKATPRVVFRAFGVPISPGHVVGLEVLALPSGAIQQYVSAEGEYTLDGAGGDVVIEVTYRNADGDDWTATASVSIAPSDLLWAAEPPATHYSLVGASAVAGISLLQPLLAVLEKFSRGGDVVADIEVREIGSTRVVDGHVVEVPSQIVVDKADSRWPSALYSDGDAAYGQAPFEYPIQQLAGDDPAGGTASIRRALFSHGRELGPLLVGWSSAAVGSFGLMDWVSYGGGVGDDEAPAASVTGTTPRLVPYGADMPGEDLPGWHCGHYGRQVDHGDHFLDGRVGVLPVWVAAYAKVSTGTGTIEVRTDDTGWSSVRLRVASASWGWVVLPGWLEVGTGPEDARVARAWAWASTVGGVVSVRYVGVWHRPRG